MRLLPILSSGTGPDEALVPCEIEPINPPPRAAPATATLVDESVEKPLSVGAPFKPAPGPTDANTPAPVPDMESENEPEKTSCIFELKETDDEV